MLMYSLPSQKRVLYRMSRYPTILVCNCIYGNQNRAVLYFVDLHGFSYSIFSNFGETVIFKKWMNKIYGR